MSPDLIVTTSRKASAPTREQALLLANQWRLPFVDRLDQSLRNTLAGSQVALLFTNSEVKLASLNNQLSFHLGTAFIRLQALSRGELDPLLRAAEVLPGDRVLDLTFGLGRDSRVIAHAVGDAGAVVGVESSVGLYHLANEGLRRLHNRPDGLLASPVSALGPPAPIQLVNSDSIDYLTTCSNDSFDVVLLDPMFDEPLLSDAGFDILRALADPTPLTYKWVLEARRVTRRWLVVKARRSLPWFASAGLTWVPSNSSANWYRTPGTSEESQS